MQLRHVLEIHSVDAGEETQRHENGHHHGQDLHDLVGALGGDGDVSVDQVRCLFILQAGEAAGAFLLFVHINDLHAAVER